MDKETIMRGAEMAYERRNDMLSSISSRWGERPAEIASGLTLVMGSVVVLGANSALAFRGNRRAEDFIEAAVKEAENSSMMVAREALQGVIPESDFEDYWRSVIAIVVSTHRAINDFVEANP